nr:Gag-Pol polyprotein [Tanacetum cinerariifolium]
MYDDYIGGQPAATTRTVPPVQEPQVRDIGFFIRYSADSCAYRIYNRRTKKIMETVNVSFDELSAMAFEQRSLKLRLQSMTSGQISSGLDLTYAPSTITKQQPTEDNVPIPTNSSSHATNVPITS